MFVKKQKGLITRAGLGKESDRLVALALSLLWARYCALPNDVMLETDHMLETLRKGAASWVAKIFLGILVVSFGIWGIGDIFRNFGRENFARVGSTDISADTFRTAYDRERQRLSRQSGRAVSNDQVRALGLHTELVRRIVTETVFDEQARNLTVGVSDKEIARSILDDPNFAVGGSGGFNRIYFEQLLRENGLTEAGYVVQRRLLSLRRQLADALAGSLEAPKIYSESINRFANERRSAIYFILPSERFAKVEPPDEQTLQGYYELVRGAFRTPARRGAEVLKLSLDEMSRGIAVSDDDARQIYEAQKARFGTIEKRKISQISFPNAEAAAATSNKLKEGQSFEAALEALGQKASEVELGVVGAEEIIDPVARAAAFALPVGKASEPVITSFGPVILYIHDIIPGNVQAFAAVSAQIKAEMARDRARKALLDFVDKVEDDRAGGSRLGEIATKYNLPFLTVAAIDREGVDETGQDQSVALGGRPIVDAIFRTTPGGEPDAIRLNEGGSIWFDVREVIPDRERPLADVRDQVIARWIEEKERAALLSKADDIIAKINTGTSIDDAAKELGLETRQSAITNRTGTLADFSRAGIEDLFRASKGKPGTTLAENRLDRLVFIVATRELPDAAAPADDQVLRDVREGIKNDVLTGYIAELEKEIGVTINRSLVERLSQSGGS